MGRCQPHTQHPNTHTGTYARAPAHTRTHTLVSLSSAPARGVQLELSCPPGAHRTPVSTHPLTVLPLPARQTQEQCTARPREGAGEACREQRRRPRPAAGVAGVAAAAAAAQCGWDGRAGTGPPSLHFLFNDQREGSHGPSCPWDLSETTHRKSCTSKGLFFFFSG